MGGQKVSLHQLSTFGNSKELPLRANNKVETDLFEVHGQRPSAAQVLFGVFCAVVSRLSGSFRTRSSQCLVRRFDECVLVGLNFESQWIF